MNRERLNRSDWILIGVCAAVIAVSLFVVFNWFSAAFPEASIEFRYDREASRGIADRVLADEHIDARGMKHTAVFDGDDTAKIFLERTLGLTKANAILRRDVRLWWWRHRWFKPLQEEEYQVYVAPTGEIVYFSDKIPESRALPAVDIATARQLATGFLTRNRVRLADLQLVSESEVQLPNRLQRIFTWESQSIHPAGAPYRHEITIDGNRISRYRQSVKVPEEWVRSYQELRSKNFLAGKIDLVFFAITMIAAVVIFIIRLLRGDVRVRFVIGIAIATIVLVTGVSLNSFPLALAGYDTTTSYPAWLGSFILGSALQSLGVAMLLVVMVGSGEVLYRERLPQHLAIPKLWSPRVLTSKRVFLSFIIGYTLVAFFLGYQVAFYLIAEKFGAWAPAEVPYDDMLNTAFPWIAVLFAGFFPALSEEFMSRAFSIPFFERVLRSRVGAIVVAGFIWGFGHATYPNQPFYIRGVEVGIAGVLIGFLMFRFGMLPLLIWHYTVDALYTSLLLLRSGNHYYQVSSGLASLVFAVPMLLCVVLYFRNKGFIVDDDLSNATIPVHPPPPPTVQEEIAAGVAAPVPVTRSRLVLLAVSLAIAFAFLVARPASIEDVIDYRITGDEAKALSAQWSKPFAKTFTAPVKGFRSWERGSGAEEGGSPGDFDEVSAGYLLRQHFSIQHLIDVMKTRIYAATWIVRSFTPMQKEETRTEVDPRSARVIGFHRYLDEKKAGPRLEQAAALAIAAREFARYRLDVAQFDLKEALQFQQPNRRDWLFHFQERAAIAANAYRRVSVRVAGADVTQFTATIKIPDEVYREASKQTVLNVMINLVRILAGLLLFGLVIAGFVVAARKNGFRWRRALRWTAVLAIVPIAATALRWNLTSFQYDTSVQWQTFLSGQIIGSISAVGFQIGLIFLSLVAIDILHPEAFDLVWRGRRQVGRAAVIAAITAIALATIRHGLLQLISTLFPAAARVGFSVPDTVAIPIPAVLMIGDAVVRAIETSAALALFVSALRGFPGKRWLPDVIAVTAIFCVGLDSSASPREMPMAVLAAITAALLAWAVIRYVLADNILAYPLASALLSLLSGAATLFQNHRPDLIVNGVVVSVVAGALLLWYSVAGSVPAQRPPEQVT